MCRLNAEKARSLLAPSICSAGGGPTAFKGALPAAPRLARSALPAARPRGGAPAALPGHGPAGAAPALSPSPAPARPREELCFLPARLPALSAEREVCCFHAIHSPRRASSALNESPCWER